MNLWCNFSKNYHCSLWKIKFRSQNVLKFSWNIGPFFPQSQITLSILRWHTLYSPHFCYWRAWKRVKQCSQSSVKWWIDLVAQIDVLLLGDQGDYCYLSSPSSTTFFPAVWFEFRMFCVATIHNRRGTNHLIDPRWRLALWALWVFERRFEKFRGLWTQSCWLP